MERLRKVRYQKREKQLSGRSPSEGYTARRHGNASKPKAPWVGQSGRYGHGQTQDGEMQHGGGEGTPVECKQLLVDRADAEQAAHRNTAPSQSCISTHMVKKKLCHEVFIDCVHSRLIMA